MPTFDTPQPIAVIVDLAAGDVRVTASDRADSVAAVAPTNPSNDADVAAADATRIDCSEGRLVIATPKSWRRFSPFERGGSVQLSVEVPSGSTLEARSSLGDIRGDGELGRCDVKTGMGNVRLDHTGRLKLRTGFGDVDVDQVDGDADVTTGSGEVRLGRVDGTGALMSSNGGITVDEVTGDARARSANGRITIGRAGRSVVAKTAAGSIEVAELRRGVAVLETSAGDLSCGIAAGTAANLDVRSKYGQIHSALDATDRPAPDDELLELRAHTGVGDITLFRVDDRSARTS